MTDLDYWKLFFKNHFLWMFIGGFIVILIPYLGDWILYGLILPTGFIMNLVDFVIKSDDYIIGDEV